MRASSFARCGAFEPRVLDLLWCWTRASSPARRGLRALRLSTAVILGRGFRASRLDTAVMLGCRFQALHLGIAMVLRHGFRALRLDIAVMHECMTSSPASWCCMNGFD